MDESEREVEEKLMKRRIRKGTKSRRTGKKRMKEYNEKKKDGVNWRNVRRAISNTEPWNRTNFYHLFNPLNCTIIVIHPYIDRYNSSVNEFDIKLQLQADYLIDRCHLTTNTWFLVHSAKSTRNTTANLFLPFQFTKTISNFDYLDILRIERNKRTEKRNDITRKQRFLLTQKKVGRGSLACQFVRSIDYDRRQSWAMGKMGWSARDRGEVVQMFPFRSAAGYFRRCRLFLKGNNATHHVEEGHV